MPGLLLDVLELLLVSTVEYKVPVGAAPEVKVIEQRYQPLPTDVIDLLSTPNESPKVPLAILKVCLAKALYLFVSAQRVT